VETRLKGYKYFEIERDFLNKLGVLIDGDFKFGVLLLVQTVNFLVFLLEEIGSDRAHCECMRRFASFVVFCKIDKLTLLNIKLIVRVSQFSSCFPWDD
jgi:hypothetical protein